MWRTLQWAYSAILTCLLPLIFFRLWMKSLKIPAYRHRWRERLGKVPFAPLENVLWIHAVSVGEAISVIPLIHRLRVNYPTTPILITTTTPTGSERVQIAFKEILGKQLFHCYLPYDLPWVLNTFFKKITPQILILMETELWPNLLHGCYRRQLPILIANGCLSLRSSQRYCLVKGFMGWILRGIWGVAAQSQLDAQRFHQLGIAKEKIWETGNIKFDLQLPSNLKEAGNNLRAELGQARKIWIAASTHEGEEELILSAYQNLKNDFPDLLLLLVPRHPNRFNKIAQLCHINGLQVNRRTLNQTCTLKTEVFLGDTMGELLLFYAASDVAFVGGSFVNIGGHNLLEPAALSLPIVTGPQLFNITAVKEMLINAHALHIASNIEELVYQLRLLLNDKKMREQQGKQGKKVVEENRGSIERLLALIEQICQKK